MLTPSSAVHPPIGRPPSGAPCTRRRPPARPTRSRSGLVARGDAGRLGPCDLRGDLRDARDARYRDERHAEADVVPGVVRCEASAPDRTAARHFSCADQGGVPIRVDSDGREDGGAEAGSGRAFRGILRPWGPTARGVRSSPPDTAAVLARAPRSSARDRAVAASPPRLRRPCDAALPNASTSTTNLEAEDFRADLEAELRRAPLRWRRPPASKPADVPRSPRRG
jgi:hypothetical protein